MFTTLIFVLSLMVAQSITASDATPHGSWISPVYAESNSPLSTKTTVVRYSFDSKNIELRAREITVKAGLGETVRVELDSHPSGAKSWIAHTAYSTDVGQFTSVKKGSQGVVKDITKPQAAVLNSAVFEYQIVRKGNAIINYECQDAKMLPEQQGAEPLIATLFIACPEPEGQEL